MENDHQPSLGAAFPIWLPPPEQTLDWLIEENLTHPENLPLHDLNISQRFIPAVSNLDNLYKIDISPLKTTISMVRDHKTGQLTGYTEEVIDGYNHGMRLDMNREPLPSVDIRGKNIPFWPGGFDEHYELDVPLISDEALLDFHNDLLTVPPNFKRGLTFPDDSAIIDQSEMLQENRVINLTDILQMDDESWTPAENISADDVGITTTDNTVSISAEDANDVTDALECSIPITPVPSSTSVTKDTPQEESWAVMVNTNRPVKDFYTRVPHMAHNWPFELDPFQKQAIIHLENNQNVFVAAHTSAGKTVVAEYAIALSLNHLTRTIYTSPIKALSNQKFRDFRQTFGEDNVGLVTGDVQLNTTASCLIMTTEILRSMLYHGSETIRDLEWVIFDEVHYINDTERGVVWEEVLIMLPSHVNIVLLSATVPNTKEFAAWVGKTKKKKIYVVSTTKRPVPLEHFLYTGNSDKTSKELFLIVDSQGQFLTKGYDKAVAAKKERETKSSSSFGARVPRDGFAQQDRTTWLSLIKMLDRTDRLPAVAFIFSKKKIDDNATNLSSVDLTTKKKKVPTATLR